MPDGQYPGLNLRNRAWFYQIDQVIEPFNDLDCIFLETIYQHILEDEDYLDGKREFNMSDCQVNFDDYTV